MEKLICDKCGMEAHEGAEKLDKCKSPKCFAGLYRPAAAEVIEPVTRTDSYMATPTLMVEFGVDAEGRKCSRDWTPGIVYGSPSETHDSIRDAAGKDRRTKDLHPGPWRVR